MATAKIPSNHPAYYSIDPEYIKLVDFLIEKSKTVKSFLSISQLAREFKEKSGGAHTFDSLRAKFQRLRLNIHKLPIDTEVKVKIFFVLSASVDDNFLEKLKNQAEVVLDGRQRLFEYRTKGGGLELKRCHANTNEISKVIERDDRIIEFLAQKSIKADSPVVDSAFIREFKEATGATECNSHLGNRFRLLKNKIYESTDFDEKTKIRMIFVSSASVPNDFIGVIRDDAYVEVDSKNRIIKYKSHDGSLQLNGFHNISAKHKAERIEKLKRERASNDHYDDNAYSKFYRSDEMKEEDQKYKPDIEQRILESSTYKRAKPDELVEVKLEPLDESIEPKQEEFDFTIPKREVEKPKEKLFIKEEDDFGF